MVNDATYHAAEHDRRIANVLRVATVSSVDLTTTPPTARVMFTDDWESDDLPWAPAGAGRRRTWEPPAVDDQVLVGCLSGDTGAGIIIARLNSAAIPAPSSSADQDMLGDWADGGSDVYDSAAHTRTLTAPVGGQLVFVVGSSTVTVANGVITLDSPSILLGAGAEQGVARLGDQVRITTGSSAGMWPIVQASEVVKAL